MKNISKKIFLIIFLCIFSICLYNDHGATGTIFANGSKGYIVQHTGDKVMDVYTNKFILEPGVYHIEMGYTSSEPDNYFYVKNYGEEIDKVNFPGWEGVLEYELILDQETAQLEIGANYCGTGYLEIKNFSMKADQPWYYDSWLRVAGLWLFVLMVYLSRNIIAKKPTCKSVIMECWIVLGIAILSSSYLLGTIYLAGDDIGYHVGRIDGIANGLRSGQFPVMIYPKNFSYNGYLNAVYPSLFLYFPAVLRLLGVSLPTAYKMLLLMINIMTAFSMYVAMKNISVLKPIPRMNVLCAVLIYCFMGYRINNMIIRAAIGESLALAFLPLIIAGLYQILIADQKKWWMLVVGATGVVQSHVLNTMVYVFIAFALVLFCCKKLFVEKRWISLLKASVVTLLLNLWYLIPMITFYFKGGLMLDELDRTPRHSSLSIAYIFRVFDVFENPSVSYSLRLPIVLMLGICILCFVLYKKEKEKDYTFFTVLFGLSVFMLFVTSDLFPYEMITEFKILSKVLSKLQFIWRLIGVSGCIIIMVATIWMQREELLEKYSRNIMLVLALCVMIDCSNWDFSIEKNKSEYYTELSSKVCQNIPDGPVEYLRSYNLNYTSQYVTSSEDICISNYEREYLDISFSYVNNSLGLNRDYITLPFINYIGYKAFDENGKELQLSTNENGVAELDLLADGKTHEVSIEYKEPLLFRIAEIISLVTLLAYVALYMNAKSKKHKKN